MTPALASPLRPSVTLPVPSTPLALPVTVSERSHDLQKRSEDLLQKPATKLEIEMARQSQPLPGPAAEPQRAFEPATVFPLASAAVPKSLTAPMPSQVQTVVERVYLRDQGTQSD